MDSDFWHQKWEQNNIGFHQSTPNALLVNNFSKLSLEKGSRVFLPLCGKTLDVAWFISNGYRVAGAELSEKAIEQLFAELGVKPKISAAGKIKRYSEKHIDIFVGDIFDVSGEILGPVDAVYDRAALVALPENMRNRYAMHITKITKKAPQLLLCFEYDQSLVQGPPFSIKGEEVKKHYGHNYDLTLIESLNVVGGFKGKYTASENAWLLKSG